QQLRRHLAGHLQPPQRQRDERGRLLYFFFVRLRHCVFHGWCCQLDHLRGRGCGRTHRFVGGCVGAWCGGAGRCGGHVM
ncbi:hypothetical protein SLS54_009941, partial [Diplodia seriata]